MAASTFARVSLETYGRALMTFETVFVDTPAMRATSCMVAVTRPPFTAVQ